MTLFDRKQWDVKDLHLMFYTGLRTYCDSDITTLARALFDTESPGVMHFCERWEEDVRNGLLRTETSLEHAADLIGRFESWDWIGTGMPYTEESIFRALMITLQMFLSPDWRGALALVIDE